jgi:N-acetylglucosamine-6-phosphate deacetylase
MDIKLLHNFTWFRDGKEMTDSAIIIKNGTIQEIIPVATILPSFNGNSYDLQGDYLSAGFVDLHINGGNSHFFTKDLSVEAYNTIYHEHILRGNTSILPTVISTTFENMLKAIEITKECMKDKDGGILGLHLEGPYISKDRKGVHNIDYIRLPKENEINELLKKGEGVIKKMTIAPELFSIDTIRKIADQGIIVSAGHTACTIEQALDSFNAGVTCITHIFNAMPPLQGREPGLVGAALLDDKVYAGIIGDGQHVKNSAIKLMYKSIQDRLFLVSDATMIGATDMNLDGVLYYHSKESFINEKGNLAGSNITIHDAVINCVKNGGFSLETAFKMGSEIPMRVMGVKNYGKIAQDYAADLVRLDKNNLDLKDVIKSGEFVN